MQIDSLTKGGTVEVEAKCNGKNMTFMSEIIIIKNNSVLITSIKVNDQTIGFSEKCQINFLYKTEGKLFLWENVSVKLVKYDGAIYHKIDIYGEGKPYNRRDSYRMYIGEDMPLYVNSSSGPSALSVLVKDISETGVSFITKDEIDVERTIRLKLKDNNAIISLSGVIVRKEFLSNLASFLYGCKFNEKNNKLGKFLAKKQGEILKKKTTTYSSPHSKDKHQSTKNNETIEYR
ncbi:MAG: PilZ domain-containing protein [Mobilitalea sp.]